MGGWWHGKWLQCMILFFSWREAIDYLILNILASINTTSGAGLLDVVTRDEARPGLLKSSVAVR